MNLGEQVRRGFCRVSDAMRVGLPDESNNGRVIGGERNDDHERRKKRDQAAAISTGHHAAVRQVVHRLPVESAQSRRDDARARRLLKISETRCPATLWMPNPLAGRPTIAPETGLT